MKRITLIMAAFILGATLMGCGGGSSTPAVLSSAANMSAVPVVSSVMVASSVTVASSKTPASKVSSTPSSIALTSSSMPSGLAYRGVALAGAEFGADHLPGAYATHYTYPNQAEVDYFKSKTMNTLRLPFLWERLQPNLNEVFDSTELARVDKFVMDTTEKGMHVILDPHNYARYNNNLVGSSNVPNAAFADFWSRLAEHFKGNDKIIFALMNEPHDMPTEQWLNAANAAIVAIRATGASNLILVPGNAWTGAHSWALNYYGTANAVAMLNIVDSGNNYAFEVHQYLDSNSSGSSTVCLSATIGVERLTAFTAWLNTNNKRGFLGEFAGANNATCQAAVTGMLQHLQANSNVWIGWTWWAAGPWWGAYMYTLEPTGKVDAPQINWLAPYLL